MVTTLYAYYFHCYLFWSVTTKITWYHKRVYNPHHGTTVPGVYRLRNRVKHAITSIFTNVVSDGRRIKFISISSVYVSPHFQLGSLLTMNPSRKFIDFGAVFLRRPVEFFHSDARHKLCTGLGKAKVQLYDIFLCAAVLYHFTRCHSSSLKF